MKKNIINILNNLDVYSKKEINECNDLHDINDDIRWFANCCPPLNKDTINYYINEPYAKQTRYDLFIECIEVLKEINVNTVIDIGSGTGFFPYLVNTNSEINCFGIEPRNNLVLSSNEFYSSNVMLNEKLLFCGNIKTFNEHIENYNVKVGCVTILNFLHGNDHIATEIEKLFSNLNKITNYIIISEPQNISTSPFVRVRDIGANKQHGLYTNLNHPLNNKVEE